MEGRVSVAVRSMHLGFPPVDVCNAKIRASAECVPPFCLLLWKLCLVPVSRALLGYNHPPHNHVHAMIDPDVRSWSSFPK